MTKAAAPVAPSRSFVPFAVKATDDAARTFTGLAAAWSLDSGGDVIHKGAFARTLDHWRQAKKVRPIPLLDQHKYDSVNNALGKMLEASETDDGLLATFDFIAEDDAADKAYRRVKGGYVTGLSIGYSAVKWDYEKPEGGNEWDRVRHLYEVKLVEVSLVLWPMNDDARVDAESVKGLLAALRDGRVTDTDKQHLRALLTDPPPDEAKAGPDGLAPDHPQRLQAEALVREVTLRSLATR